MPEYDLLGEVWARVCVLLWAYVLWRAHRKREFPLKFRGFNVLLVYTKWRMYAVLGIPLILMGIPVFIWGMDYGEMMSARDQLSTFLIFWSSVILIPATWLIATIAQIVANDGEKPKHNLNESP